MWIDTRMIIKNVILIVIMAFIGSQFTRFDLCQKLPVASQSVFMIHYCGFYLPK